MRLHRELFKLFGYDILHLEKKQPNLESHLKVMLKQLGIHVVFDVGANTGQFGLMLRKLGYKGHIFSFEPVAKSYRELETASAGDDKWMICNYALGAAPGSLEINVTHATTFASFLTPNDYARDIRGEEVPVTGRETVDVRKLDDVFDEIISKVPHAERRIFLKMDTQGFDLEVFKGARHTIQRVTALQSEISILPLYNGMPDYIQSLSAFRKEGFELTGMYPVSRDDDTMCLVELDCIMRRIQST